MMMILLALFLCYFAMFIIGSLWYSPRLFGKTWLKLAHPGASHEEMKKQGMANELFVTSLTQIALLILVTFIVKVYLGYSHLHQGLGFGTAASMVAVLVDVPHAAFSGQPVAWFLIDKGFDVVVLTVCSVIITLVA